MKTKLLRGLISACCLLLFETGRAQAPLANFSLSQTTVCAGTPVLITDLSTGIPTGWIYTLNGGLPASAPIPNPIVVYNSAGVYTITLIALNSTGPSAPMSQTVLVNPQPTLTVSGGTSLCNGASLTQTVAGADSYTWSTGSITSTETLSPTADMSYTVTGTNAVTGCSVSNIVNITVNPLPVLSISGGTAACLGSGITQTVSGADTYVWEGGATTSTVSFSPTVPSTYSVTGTSALSGCTGSATVLIGVNIPPVIAVAGDNTVCAGSAITQTASGGDTYLWDNGSTTDVVSFNPTSNTVYTVTGTSTLTGCSGIAMASVTVSAPPSLTLSGNTAFCAGGSTSLTASGADTYSWSTGATTGTETFSPAANTTYTVTGTDAASGCSSSSTVEIDVNALPVLSVSGASAACMGSSITQTVSGADTYLWSDGQTTAVATLTPNTPTTYTVTGTITLSGCSDFTTVTLGVNALPVISIAGDNTVCAGSALTQTASGGDTYLWSDASTTDVVTFNPTSNTVYTVTGTSTLTGCFDIATASITVSAPPSLTLSGSTAFCAGGSVTQTVSGADTYLWSTGATADNETFNPTSTTTYTVTGTDALSGCSTSNTLEITVNALPVLSVSGPTAACLGSSVSQTVTGADTYTWSSGATSDVADLSPTAPTTYTVAGTIALTGCSDSTTVSIGVNALPVISVAGSTSVCSGAAITQTASGGDTYLWSDGQTSDVGTFNPTSSMVYTVTGTSTLTGCSDIATVSVTAIGLPTLALSGTMAYCEGGVTTLTVTGADTYTWSTGSNSDSETFNPATTTTYTISGSSTLTACSDSIPVLITVNVLPTITVNSGAVCAGDVFTMTPSGADTYTFSNNSATVIPTVNDSYSVTGTSTAGCISSNTAVASVTVNALPTISVSDGTICAGGSFSISPNGAATYNIEGGSASVSPATSTSYTITGTSSDGCISANTLTCNVTVNTLPTIQVTGTSTLCAGETLTLNAGGAATYTWNGTVASANFTDTPTAGGSYAYSVTGTDNNGCTNSVTPIVTVYSLPLLTVSDGTICQGSTFVLVPNGAITYTFSGGTANVSPMVTTTYTISGTDMNGCVTQAPVVATVSVVNALTVTVSGPTSICMGAAVSLTANGAPNYVWNTTATTATLTDTPTASTSYSVTGLNGPCSSQVVVNVTVNALPNLTVTSSAPLICAGEPVDLTVSGASTYTWSTVQSGTVITVSPAGNTTYTVGGVDGNGCPNMASFTQSVSACTGIAAVENGMEELSVYPNPNNGEFVIKAQQHLAVTILNSIGQAVYTGQLEEGDTTIHLEEQASGIYFIKVQQGGQSKTLKVIKN